MGSCYESLEQNEAGYVLFNCSAHTVLLFIMLPTTFCAGMTLPLLTAILLHSHHGEKAIGNVYVANTIGMIVGVLLAVHVYMSTFGLKGMQSKGKPIGVSLLPDEKTTKQSLLVP